MFSSIIENNEFSKSALFIESINCSSIMIYNSKFISNTGEKGAIYHKNCKKIKNNDGPPVYFNSTLFKNNVAKEYGGVLYYDYSDPKDTFPNCIFYNNTAPLGI